MKVKVCLPPYSLPSVTAAQRQPEIQLNSDFASGHTYCACEMCLFERQRLRVGVTEGDRHLEKTCTYRFYISSNKSLLRGYLMIFLVYCILNNNQWSRGSRVSWEMQFQTGTHARSLLSSCATHLPKCTTFLSYVPHRPKNLRLCQRY